MKIKKHALLEYQLIQNWELVADDLKHKIRIQKHVAAWNNGPKLM